MSPIPVRAEFDGNPMVLLVALDDADPIAVVATKVAHHAVGVMVAPQDRPIRVWHNDNLLDPEITVEEANIAPMDALRVAYV